MISINAYPPSVRIYSFMTCLVFVNLSTVEGKFKCESVNNIHFGHLWKMSLLLQVIVTYMIFCTAFCHVAHPDLSMHPGHLKRYGSQGKFKLVEEIDHFPSVPDFFEQYVSDSVPVVMRGVVNNTKPYREWTDEYFLNLPIPRKELLKIRIYEDPLHRPKIHLHDFVRTYNYTNDWMISEVPPYLGKGGTHTQVHNDGRDNILCVYAGNKEITLLHPDEYLNKDGVDPHAVAISYMDVESIDYTKHPDVANIEYYLKVNLSAGDCLFLPYNWIHLVFSYERNLAINMWWHHRDDFSWIVQACRGKQPKGHTVADKFHDRVMDYFLPKKQILYFLDDVTRTRPASLAELQREFLDLAIVRQYILNLFREPGKGANKINMGKYTEDYMARLRSEPGVIAQYERQVIPLIGALDQNGDGVVCHTEVFSEAVQNQVIPALHKTIRQVGKLVLSIKAASPPESDVRTLESIRRQLEGRRDRGGPAETQHSEL